MTMAAEAKLFVNASSTDHQAISDERRRREKWQLEVGPGYWRRYNSSLEMGKILVITIKRDGKGELLEHQIWLISLNMTGLWG
jgi:hypothetical protein